MVAVPADDMAAPETRGGPSPSAADQPRRSLVDDVGALLGDGRTYLEAEVAYQKSRALFVVDRGKAALVYAIAGALFALMTLLGLTVGLIISLAQLVGPWIASAIVVVALGLVAFLLLRAAQQRWNSLMEAFGASGDAA